MREEEGRSGVRDCNLAPNVLPKQTIEKRVKADDPNWHGTLECQASNSLGKWPFTAPGTVIVEPSFSSLQIRCKPPVESVAVTNDNERSVKGMSLENRSNHYVIGETAGAVVGAGLGGASAGGMGPGFDAPLTISNIWIGSEIGSSAQEVADWARGDNINYPDLVVIQIKTSKVIRLIVQTGLLIA